MNLNTAYQVYLKMTETDPKKRGYEASKRGAFIAEATKYFSVTEVARCTGLNHSTICHHRKKDSILSDHKFNAGRSVTYIYRKRIASQLLTRSLKEIN